MEKKYKIIYIIDTLTVGGAQRFLINMIKGLDREQFEPKVVTIMIKGELAKEILDLGVEVIHLQKKGKIGWSLIWQLKDFFKKEQPEIVHTNLFGSDTIGRIAAILARVPVIVSTEHNTNFDQGFIKCLVKKIISLFTAKIIAASEAIRDFSVKNDGINLKKFIVINYGIDLNEYPFRGSRIINGNKIIAGVAARLEEQKGHIYLIKALPQIVREYPGFKLQLIGGGSLLESLKKEVAALGLNGTVEFLGDRQDVPELFQNLDIFILPSVWEGLGIAILEAQAIGVPVLASNVGGIKEIVKDGETGLLFEPKDSEAIFKSIERLVSNQDLAAKIVEQANKQVRANFDYKIMVKNYTDLYLTLIKNV